jgi:hypothetical protein
MADLSAEIADLARVRVRELVDGLEPSWQRRPDRRRPVRPLVPTGRGPSSSRGGGSALDAIWDDRTERDVRGLVALLIVAAAPLRRVELAEVLHCSQARLARACGVLRTAPPYGLVRVEHADRLRLATARMSGGWWKRSSTLHRRSRYRRLPWKYWPSSPTSSPCPGQTSSVFAASIVRA